MYVGPRFCQLCLQPPHPPLPSSDQTAFWMSLFYFSTLPDLINTFPGYASPEQMESCTASVMMVSLDYASSGYGRTHTYSFFQLFLNIPRNVLYSLLLYHVFGQDASSYLTSFSEIFCLPLPVKPCTCAMPHHLLVPTMITTMYRARILPIPRDAGAPIADKLLESLKLTQGVVPKQGEF